MKVSEIAVVGSVIVSAFGAIFGLYQARKADRSATTTRTIEIGVTNLVDQYQEANADLRNELTELKSQYSEIQAEVRVLKRRVNELETVLDDKDAEIIRLKGELGELK